MSLPVSRQSSVLVLMYHYIHGSRAAHLQGLHGLTDAALEQQLGYLQEHYRVLDYPSFLQGLNGEQALPPRCALITFDDGTIDQYTTAYPVLKRLGLPATFFVITDAVENRRLAAVHARHLLARALGEEGLRRAFIDQLAVRTGRTDGFEAVADETARRAYRWDDLETARFKYAVNFGLPSDARNAVLKDLFGRNVGDWAEAGDAFYVSWEHLRAMKAGGMQIGGHSHHHEALSLLDPAAACADLHRCHTLLVGRLGADAYPFSYPFGKQEHFSADVMETLREVGFSASFANIQGLNTVPRPASSLKGYQLLRIDPKDLITYAVAEGSF